MNISNTPARPPRNCAHLARAATIPLASSRRIPFRALFLATLLLPLTATGDPPAPRDTTAIAAALPPGLRPHVRRDKNGAVNWTTGTIVAEGLGKSRGTGAQDRLMAERAARVVASRNLVLLSLGLQVDRRVRFSDIRDAKISLEAFLVKSEQVSIDWNEKVSPPQCTVRVEAPLWGAHGTAAIAFENQRERAGHAAMLEAAGPLDGTPGADEWILVDARGIPLTPTLFPIVMRADGRVLYHCMKRRQVHGEVRPSIVYVEMAPDAPSTAPAPTTAPDAGPVITVRARQAGGPYRSDVILSRTDCKLLAESPRASRMMLHGRVIVIVAPAPAPK